MSEFEFADAMPAEDAEREARIAEARLKKNRPFWAGLLGFVRSYGFFFVLAYCAAVVTEGMFEPDEPWLPWVFGGGVILLSVFVYSLAISAFGTFWGLLWWISTPFRPKPEPVPVPLLRFSETGFEADSPDLYLLYRWSFFDRMVDEGSAVHFDFGDNAIFIANTQFESEAQRADFVACCARWLADAKA